LGCAPSTEPRVGPELGRPVANLCAFGVWRSLVARSVRVGEVPSSNLGTPTEAPGSRTDFRVLLSSPRIVTISAQSRRTSAATVVQADDKEDDGERGDADRQSGDGRGAEGARRREACGQLSPGRRP